MGEVNLCGRYERDALYIACARKSKHGPVSWPYLNHELLDDPVEDVAVVVAVPRMDAEVLHRLGTLLREELHVDVAHGGMQCGLGGKFNRILNMPRKSPKNITKRIH